MSDAVIVGIIGFLGTLCGSLLGILVAQKLLNFRVATLEKHSENHENEIRRIDTQVTKLEGRTHEVEHDVRDLKKFHIPN